MLKFLVKEPDPKELVRKWQATLRAEQRVLERQVRGRWWLGDGKRQWLW